MLTIYSNDTRDAPGAMLDQKGKYAKQEKNMESRSRQETVMEGAQPENAAE